MVACACNPGAGEADMGDPWAHCQAGLPYLVSSRPVRDLISIKDRQHMREDAGGCLHMYP